MSDEHKTTDWPARRGVPLNPERDGRHWVRWLGRGPQPDAEMWCSRRQVWLIDGETMGPGWVGPQTVYHGPVQEPAT